MAKDDIGSRIKQFRKQKGITQEKLAKDLGYSHKSVVTHIEKGEADMSVEKLLLFLRKYAVDANDFLEIQNIDNTIKSQRRGIRELKDRYKDVLVEINGIIFSYRVSGILIDNDKIMLTKHGDTYTIPGGHVHIGELSIDAIEREYKEETGLDVEAISVIATLENFWKMKGKDCHQINIIYRVGYKGLVQQFDPNPDNDNTEFVWVDIKVLPTLNIYPKEIIKIISDDTKISNHYIIHNK